MRRSNDKRVIEESAGQSRDWNYHPDLPILMSPVFESPPKPKAAIAWLLGTWIKLTPALSHTIFAVVCVMFFLPPIELMQTLSFDWVAQIFMMNFGALLLLAGAFHTYLYIVCGQGQRLKFDVRPMEKNTRFTFGHQVKDNIFWSLASAVPIWSAWMVLYFYVAANQRVPSMGGVSESPVWFILLFFVIRFWQSFHFYWIHRLIHWPWLFKHVHHLHHRNINVGPWSGLSMHPLEHVLYFSGILIHFVLPSHPLHVVFHMFSLSLGAVYSHSGYDRLIVKSMETFKAGSFHHQLHHRYFECNYGSEEIPLDRWFNSFHDGTKASNKHIRERKKRIFASRR